MDRKMFIAFPEHTCWVYARDPLKEPVEFAGAAACFRGLTAGVLGWKPTFISPGL